MKASELIKILEKGINEHGDMSVLMEHPIDWAPAPARLSAVYELDHKLNPMDKADHFTFDVDDESEAVKENFSHQLKEIKGK